ncbi:TniB family NTP-binding protein [Sphingomonas sp. dw_22]|uniref:TniB family NTP-binding protein n=1 Tax=Sphingomonas sp. dw_22 TaxID=2721175 RepID=UPI001BD3F254|nr:TniB family NTP-binding protein [Sphingomonas sp. dw_22]
MSEVLGHLHPDYRPIALLSDKKRIEWIRTERWVGFPKAAGVVERLQTLLDYPKRPRMPCLLIYGRSGMGKSMAIAKFVREHPAVFDKQEGSTAMPVVAFQMPKEPLEEDFYDQLLAAVGLSFRQALGKREASRLSMRMLKELGTRILIVDEMNNMLAGTSRQQRLFLNLIRFITNELSMPIVCAGTPEAHRALLFDQHLADRFDAIELTPWRNDESFALLLRSLASTRPLREPSDLEGGAVRKRLMQLSEGITGRVFRLVEEAAIAAIKSGRERIDEDAFADDALVPPLASMQRAGRARRELFSA